MSRSAARYAGRGDAPCAPARCLCSGAGSATRYPQTPSMNLSPNHVAWIATSRSNKK